MGDFTLPSGAEARLQRLVAARQEEARARSAVRQGLLAEERLREALAERDGDPSRTLGAILVERGWIDRDAWRALRPEAGPSEAPAEVVPLLDDPSRAVGEFVLVSPLGRGGAAEVWKAWDRRLHRWVAVKRPASLLDTPTARERFRREAFSAARLSHPNIVPIHRVSEEEDRPFLVMPLIRGRSLAEERPPLPRALEVMRSVALAVHYAHAQGVVHRDLKPGNIMLDDRGVAWVLDFGLAYLFEAGPKLTKEGAVAGTPSYMSPEQARGDPGAHEAATDIYSLGATLYELAAGRAPFEGTSFAEIVHKVAHDDPEPPRRVNPALGRDLETVILTAMDKDPGRRYPNAGELARDLERLLADEPIAARPVPRIHRLWRRVRKNRAALALAAVAALALAGGGLLWLAGTEQTEAEREKRLQAVREKARFSLEAALEFRRMGSIDRMRSWRPVLESACQQAPDVAEVDYLLGRFYRALMEDEKALESQQRALRKDPGYVPALYERALLLSKKYRRELRRAHEAMKALEGGGTTAREVRQIPMYTLEQVEAARPDLVRMREGLVRDLVTLKKRSAEPSDGEGAFLGRAAGMAAEGILAYHLGQYPEAIAVLSEVVKRDPFLEEAWETLARAANLRLAQGPEDLERRWSAAEHWYTQGLNRDQGYLPLLFGRSDVRRERAGYRMNRGEDPLPDYAQSEEDLTRAISLDGRSAEAWTRRGIIRATRAIFRLNRGEDPLSDLSQAEADFGRAMELRHPHPEALARRGFARSHRGIYRLAAGEDPSADFASAEEDFDLAARQDPGVDGLWMWWGFMRSQWGAFRMERGQDPRDDFARSERHHTEAIRLNREYAAAWKNRGLARTWRGVHRASRGEDPSADFADAEEDFSETLRIDRGYSTAWKNRGFLETHRGLWRLAGGESPLEHFEAAEESFGEAIRLNPSHGESFAQRGSLRWSLAQWREKGGERPGAAYAAAASDFREAIRLNPLTARPVGDRLEKAERKARDFGENP
jgi:serine/threonine-protein kinase